MPTLRPQSGDLPHIEFVREPDWQPERRRRPAIPPRPPVPENRLEHANRLASAIANASSAAAGVGEELGVDPSKLQVLAFNIVNLEAEDVLRLRYGANVVHEHKTQKGKGESAYRLVVQFPDAERLQAFQQELSLYGAASGGSVVQPPGERAVLFDGLLEVRPPSAEDRLGPRLATEGIPETGEFYLDVDLWHPGDEELALGSLDVLREVCGRFQGRVRESLRTPSLLLAKVQGNANLVRAILRLPIVARADLPPKLLAPYANLLLPEAVDVPELGLPEDDDPLVTVIDSGVVAGHPLLVNWVVEERDFGAGTGSEVDDHGHGTAVASLVVHGSVSDCLRRSRWAPRVRVCSAKVLRKHEASQDAEFPEDLRIERVFEEVIRYFHRERGCRIFNISVEREPELDEFGRQRQYPWAQLLDELARELDVVIVVLAGNADIPIPEHGHTTPDFQKAIRDGMKGDAYRVSNPGTAALAITVGSVARSDATGPDVPEPNGTGVPTGVAGAPIGAPSPFTRVGPGYRIDDTKSVIKPDVVQFGGNAALRSLAGGRPSWTNAHGYLGEPVAKFDFAAGRIVTGQAGTSFASPHVAHEAAVASVALESSIGRPPSANLIRAVIGSATRTPDCGAEWLNDEETSLRLVGYGFCDTDMATWSRPNSVRLLAEDQIDDDRLLVYRVVVPSDFLQMRGRRGITVALAFDPPVRATRREYLARTMWVEILQGLSRDQIANFRARYENTGDAPTSPGWAELKFRPSKRRVAWSILQVRRKVWSQRPRIRTPPDETEPVLHVLVGSQRRFDVGETGPQRFALVAHFWHDAEAIDIHQQLRSAIRLPATRLRVDVR